MTLAIRNERPLLLSAIIATTIIAFFDINRPNEAGQLIELSTIELLLKILYSTIASVYILICIRLIRGKVKTSNKKPYIDTEIGVWGYVWRFFVVAWLTSFSMIVSFFLPMETNIGKAVFLTFVIVFIPFITLVVFGSDRVNKLKRAMWYLSGNPTV